MVARCFRERLRAIFKRYAYWYYTGMYDCWPCLPSLCIVGFRYIVLTEQTYQDKSNDSSDTAWK